MTRKAHASFVLGAAGSAWPAGRSQATETDGMRPGRSRRQVSAIEVDGSVSEVRGRRGAERMPVELLEEQ